MIPFVAQLFVGILGLAIGGYLARGWLRQLYAPPSGGVRLLLTWVTAGAVAIYSFSIANRRAALGLALLFGSLFLALTATILFRDATNRAEGRPAGYVAIPEPLTISWRIILATVALSATIVAGRTLTIEDEIPWEAVAALCAVGYGFGIAAAQGRIPVWLRSHLHLADPAPTALPGENSASDSHAKGAG